MVVASVNHLSEIMLIDDDLNFLEMGKLYMEKGGNLVIDTFSSCHEALEALAIKLQLSDHREYVWQLIDKYRQALPSFILGLPDG